MNRRRTAATAVLATLLGVAAMTGVAAAQASTTTTIEDVIGEPLSIERPPPDAPTTTTVRPTEVLGVELQRPAPAPAPARLARTGIDAFGLTVLGLGSVALGDLLLRGARRRRDQYSR